MKKRQLKIFWGGAGIIVALILIPPWKFTFYVPSRVHVEKPGPYSLVFAPPTVPVTSTSRSQYGTYEYFQGYDRERWQVSIDYGRLALPVAAVGLATCALLFTSKAKRSE